ncbi:MAG TPA: ATP-dependent metallopeptidase FtsH/Yme1/Tma family protein [Solirubrobacteraceae bacterium]|nr:ATP-dependent metallopeptidase FtsH/Yme1/Tma family protein [Solirubrobacteraceae bacterium]
MIRRPLIASLVTAALLALATSAHAADTQVPEGKTVESSYSTLQQAIEAHTIQTAKLHPREGVAEVELTDGRKLKVEYPPTDENLAEDLADAGAKVSIENRGRTSGLAVFSMFLLPLLMVAALAFALMRGRGAGANGQGGKQKVHGARIADDNIPSVRFSDVAGVEEVVDSLDDLLVFLKTPERFERLGAQLPRGVIFHGPPGTGKTLLAKALAGEAEVPFYSVSGSDFVEMFVGRGAARVRELFADARRNPAAVIFFDEFDALGKKRGSGAQGGNDEREQTLNQLLVEMDGFNTSSRVICIAATNRLDTLDPAVLRPGRFGTQLHVDLPSEQGRREILEVHSRSKPLAKDVDLDRLARITYGSSGADLADMLNRAAILAGKADQDVITQANIEDGYLDSIAGPRKRSAVLAEGEREVVAVHEAGHVLAAELCPTVEKAMRVSIEQRGRAGGLAIYGRTDRMLQSQQYLHEKLIAALGGRAAEFVSRGVITSGAANDLQQANAMARAAVEQLGFSEKAGQLVTAETRVADKTAGLIDDEVRRLVEDAYQDAIRLLSAHKDELMRLSDALLEHEDLDRVEIVACLSGVAETPRAQPRRAAPQPQPHLVAVPTPRDRPSPPAPRRPRRGERVRARLAAALLRERPASRPAHAATRTD